METKLNRGKMEKSIVYPQKAKNNDKSSNKKASRNHYLQVWGRDCTLVGVGGEQLFLLGVKCPKGSLLAYPNF